VELTGERQQRARNGPRPTSGIRLICNQIAGIILGYSVMVQKHIFLEGEMNRNENESFPSERLFAKLSTLNGVTSFAPHVACIRLFAVSPQSFEAASFNSEDGTDIFVVEIPHTSLPGFDLSEPLSTLLSFLTNSPKRELEEIESYWSNLSESLWFKVGYRLRSSTSNNQEFAIGYQAFTDGTPIELILTSIDAFNGPPIQQPGKLDTSTSRALTVKNTKGTYALNAFHVGQGMCSLLTDGKDGVLFDAGAAKPVHRDEYKKQVKSNQLRKQIESIATSGGKLELFLSHDDYDHWCLLEWDSSLRSSLQSIFVPTGVTNLAYRSRVIVSKVFQIGDSNFSLAIDTHVNIFRTLPSYEPGKSNSEALVTTVEIGNRRALLPGDYVYLGMATDKNTSISSLICQKFAAVMVPHHGEDLTKWLVPVPKKKKRSIAFFSAGTHAGYKHPSPDAIAAHKLVEYDVVSKRHLKTAKAHRLL
jgi:beta-lactamase superfamily II metal-dependent hydrolase